MSTWRRSLLNFIEELKIALMHYKIVSSLPLKVNHCTTADQRIHRRALRINDNYDEFKYIVPNTIDTAENIELIELIQIDVLR